MSLTVDTSTRSGDQATWVHPCTTLPDRRLYVGVSHAGDGDPASVSFHDVLLTKIGSVRNAIQRTGLSLWRLINPDAGTHPIVVTSSGPAASLACSYAGALQTADPDVVLLVGETEQGVFAIETLTASRLVGVLARVPAADPADEGRWCGLVVANPLDAVAPPPPDPPPPDPPPPPATADFALSVVMTRTGDGQGFPLYPPPPAWVLSGQSNGREVRRYLDPLAAAAGAIVTGYAEGGNPIGNWAVDGAIWVGWVLPALRGPNVQAFIWSQGEADATNPATVATYAANLADLLARVRAAVANPHLRIVIVELGPRAEYDAVRAIQHAYVASDPEARLVTTSDLTDNGGHFFPDGYQAIAARIAEAIRLP